MNHYVLLHIPETANDSQVEAAYARFCEHIAQFGEATDAQSIEIKFPEIWQAYEVLRDAEKRQAYDETLNLRQTVATETLQTDEPLVENKLSTVFSYLGMLLLASMVIIFLCLLSGYSL